MWIGYLVSYETISPKHIKPFTSNMVRDNKNSPLKSLAILLDIYTDNPYNSKWDTLNCIHKKSIAKFR